MTSLTVTERPVAFHMGVNTTNLERAIEFYRVLFGIEPAKCHPDYAKFELSDPPVVFSLFPAKLGAGGAMSHLGLRLTSETAIRAIQQRLHAAGIRTREQNAVRGCYAVQTKVWVEDPDQNQWEIYIVSEDIPGGSVIGGCQSQSEPSCEEGPDRLVTYKGPFREVSDAAGRVFPRGQVVSVPPQVWEDLRQGPAATQFVFFVPAPAMASCN